MASRSGRNELKLSVPVTSWFGNLRRNEDEPFMADLTLHVGPGATFRAHSLILGAAVPHFTQMFQKGVEDDVWLPEDKMSKIGLSAMLRIVYGQEMTLTDENVQEVHRASIVFGMEQVTKSCFNFMKDGINPENAISVWEYSHWEFAGAPELLDACTGFIQENFGKVYQSEDFPSLELQKVVALLSIKDIKVTDENEILDAVLQWLNRDWGFRYPDAEICSNMVLWSKVDFVKLHDMQSVKFFRGKVSKNAHEGMAELEIVKKFIGPPPEDVAHGITRKYTGDGATGKPKTRKTTEKPNSITPNSANVSEKTGKAELCAKCPDPVVTDPIDVYRDLKINFEMNEFLKTLKDSKKSTGPPADDQVPGGIPCKYAAGGSKGKTISLKVTEKQNVIPPNNNVNVSGKNVKDELRAKSPHPVVTKAFDSDDYDELGALVENHANSRKRSGRPAKDQVLREIPRKYAVLDSSMGTITAQHVIKKPTSIPPNNADLSAKSYKAAVCANNPYPVVAAPTYSKQVDFVPCEPWRRDEKNVYERMKNVKKMTGQPAEDQILGVMSRNYAVGSARNAATLKVIKTANPMPPNNAYVPEKSYKAAVCAKNLHSVVAAPSYSKQFDFDSSQDIARWYRDWKKIPEGMKNVDKWIGPPIAHQVLGGMSRNYAVGSAGKAATLYAVKAPNSISPRLWNVVQRAHPPQ